MTALLPCPFCGRKPISSASGDGTGLMIECVSPGCPNPHVSFIPPQLAITAWNTRPAPTLAEAMALPEVQALVEAAKEIAAILQAAVVAGKLRGADSYRIGGVYLQTVSDALDATDSALAPFTAAKEPKA